MEEDALRTGRVLEDGEDCRHGSPDVCCVEGHCNMYCFIRADVPVTVLVVVVVVTVRIVGNGGAVWGIVELRGFFELMGDSASVCSIAGGGGGGWTLQQEEG